MRPGGTQTKRGAAVRMRRRLGLAPRAYALLSCSLVLVIAGVSAYGMTLPSMIQAHAAREPRVGHETLHYSGAHCPPSKAGMEREARFP